MADRYRVSAADIMADAPETQKRRVEHEKRLLKEKEAALAAKEEARNQRDAALKERTLKYHEEYDQTQAAILAKKQEAEATGAFYVPSEPRIMLVIRIKGINKLAPEVRKVFQLFRLYQIHNAVFIKINKSTMKMLRHIEPFVAYGYPSPDLIRKLVYRRGYLRMGHAQAALQSRVRIQSNDDIEALLGKHGICGVEDMIHEIATCGPHFKEVNSALWTFKLRAPRGGFVDKRHGFTEFRKGDWGNREDLIDELVEKML